MLNIGFISLGCSKNLVDSEHIIALFKDGFRIENDPAKCDVILINTCGFILSAKEEAIDTILEMAAYKEKRLKKLIVCGCFVQRYFDECREEFPEVDAFIRIDDYDRITEILGEVLGHDFSGCDRTERTLLTPPHFAYLRIADGCNHRCAYCAIPGIRGNYVSEPLEKLIAEAKKLSDAGVKELDLIAQDCAYYGRDLYKHCALSELLKELDKMDFTWIRMLYLYPEEIDEELLQTIKESKHVLPYFDMPVQYGSDRILRSMRRPTNVKMLKEKFALIHSSCNGEETMRTTMMVGFPGEKEEDYEETLQFIKDCRFDSLGAFAYSREEGTPSYDFPEQVDEEFKEERYEKLMALQQEVVCEKNQQRVGRVYPVLIEQNDPLRRLSYGRAVFSAPEGVDPAMIIRHAGKLPVGEFVNVKIEKADAYEFYGTVQEEES